MGEQTKEVKDRKGKSQQHQGEDVTKGTVDAVEKGRKLKEGIDKILDTIDEVLEENAAEFTKNYVQKGGE